MSKSLLSALVVCLGLSGCAAIPLAVGAGVGLGGTYAGNQNSRELQDYSVAITKMNCTQLRAEVARLDAAKAQQFNPFSTNGSKRDLVFFTMRNRGCRLPG